MQQESSRDDFEESASQAAALWQTTSARRAYGAGLMPAHQVSSETGFAGSSYPPQFYPLFFLTVMHIDPTIMFCFDECLPPATQGKPFSGYLLIYALTPALYCNAT